MPSGARNLRPSAKSVSLLAYVKKLIDKMFIPSSDLLDFNGRTFAEFPDKEVGINSSDPANGTKGTSKADQLWTLFGIDDVRVIRAIALWDYEQTRTFRTTDSEELK